MVVMFLRTTQSLECWDPTSSVVGVIGRKRGVGGEPETSDITWDVCSDTRGWWRSRGRGKSGVVCCLWPTADLDQISVVAFTFVWLTADLMQGHSFLSSRPWLPPPPTHQHYLLHCWLFQTRSADKLLKQFSDCLQNSFYKLHTETNKTCFKEPVK